MAEMAVEIEESPFDRLFRVLGSALDLRDDETAGHSRRVVSYCLEVGRAAGCSADELRQIARGAYVHDIGKIAIPDAILRKRGKLTTEEFEVMETHTWIGYNMMSEAPPLAEVADMILAHHERWDGSGYPRGLRGESIPVEARVFAIADTLDAMTTDRPYRKALPLSVAWAEINRESGRQFDPEIVEAFLSIPERVMQELVLMMKRRSLRVPLGTKVTFGANGEGRILKALNISEGGMLLGNALGVAIGIIVDLQFGLPEAPNPIITKGRVIRKELPARIGVAFIDISPDALEAIREYVGQRVEA
jgi:hypothetical protein